jgi:hypothetical protein
MNRPKIACRISIGALAFLLCAQILLLARYWRDRLYLQHLSTQIVDSSAPPSEQTKQILAFFRGKSSRSNSSYFLLPVFESLRPTARQVAEQGGDCADRSRLTVVLLRMRNIPAEKWTLYYPQGHPKHSVVEVQTELGKMAVDPLFGLFFPRPLGGYYSVAELRANPDLLRQRVVEMETHHQEPLAAPIERYPIDVYNYAYAKTLNWGKFPATQFVYAALHPILGRSLDDIPRPAWPEEPALVVVVVIAALELFVVVAALYFRRLGSDRVPAMRVENAVNGCNHTPSIPTQVS